MKRTELHKIIRTNEEKFGDARMLTDFVNDYTPLEGDINFEKLEDYISERADAFVPIYNSDIIEVWSSNDDIAGLAIEITGQYTSMINIYSMMCDDLYFWYEQKLGNDFKTLMTLLETEEVTD